MTPAQQLVIDSGGPRAWACIASSGFVAVFVDRASAERYARNTHGIVVPLAPERQNPQSDQL